MTTTGALLTADDFARLPADASGGRMELVDGRVVCMAPPGYQHGQLSFRVAELLAAFVRQHRLGDILAETGFLLRRNPDLVRAPDAAFVRRERREPSGLDRGYFDGPPDLAIEVVSPGDTADEVARKVEEYLVAGTGRVWIVQPALSAVIVYQPGFTSRTFHPGDTLSSAEAGFAVDGLSLSVDALFTLDP